MGLIIAEGGGEANVDLPISSDAQEAVVSTLSVASSVLLFVIIAGSGESDGLFYHFSCCI